MTEDARPARQPDEQDETALIRRARGGDDQAWEKIVGRYQTAVFRLAYLKMQDAVEAEDVAQEVFVRAFLALESFEIGRPIRPWLMAITVNLARNRRRSIGRYLHNLRRLIEREPEPVQMHAVSQDYQAKEQARVLWQAVQQLNDKAQEVVYLRYFLEMSEAETAETLGIAPGTVKSRLHRALKQLRAVIERDYPGIAT